MTNMNPNTIKNINNENKEKDTILSPFSDKHSNNNNNEFNNLNSPFSKNNLDDLEIDNNYIQSLLTSIKSLKSKFLIQQEEYNKNLKDLHTNHSNIIKNKDHEVKNYLNNLIIEINDLKETNTLQIEEIKYLKESNNKLKEKLSIEKSTNVSIINDKINSIKTEEIHKLKELDDKYNDLTNEFNKKCLNNKSKNIDNNSSKIKHDYDNQLFLENKVKLLYEEMLTKDKHILYLENKLSILAEENNVLKNKLSIEKTNLLEKVEELESSVNFNTYPTNKNNLYIKQLECNIEEFKKHFEDKINSINNEYDDIIKKQSEEITNKSNQLITITEDNENIKIQLNFLTKENAHLNKRMKENKLKYNDYIEKHEDLVSNNKILSKENEILKENLKNINIDIGSIMNSKMDEKSIKENYENQYKDIISYLKESLNKSENKIAEINLNIDNLNALNEKNCKELMEKNKIIIDLTLQKDKKSIELNNASYLLKQKEDNLKIAEEKLKEQSNDLLDYKNNKNDYLNLKNNHKILLEKNNELENNYLDIKSKYNELEYILNNNDIETNKQQTEKNIHINEINILKRELEKSKKDIESNVNSKIKHQNELNQLKLKSQNIDYKYKSSIMNITKSIIAVITSDNIITSNSNQSFTSNNNNISKMSNKFSFERSPMLAFLETIVVFLNKTKIENYILNKKLNYIIKRNDLDISIKSDYNKYTDDLDKVKQELESNYNELIQRSKNYVLIEELTTFIINNKEFFKISIDTLLSTLFKNKSITDEDVLIKIPVNQFNNLIDKISNDNDLFWKQYDKYTSVNYKEDYGSKIKNCINIIVQNCSVNFDYINDLINSSSSNNYNNNNN